MAANRKSVNFEKALSELEALVERMEDGELSLEESLKAFESGIRLTQQCQQALGDAQQRVQVLVEQGGAVRAFTLDGAALDDTDADDTDSDPDGDDD